MVQSSGNGVITAPQTIRDCSGAPYLPNDTDCRRTFTSVFTLPTGSSRCRSDAMKQNNFIDQAGAALITSLIFLTVLTILGMSTLGNRIAGKRMAAMPVTVIWHSRPRKLACVMRSCISAIPVASSV